jgi:hypothetical protein
MQRMVAVREKIESRALPPVETGRSANPARIHCKRQSGCPPGEIVAL